MAAADLGRVDVLVIGAGNAAANAALQAREMGATVAMLETAPKEARGGNSAFTGGGLPLPVRPVGDPVAPPPGNCRPPPPHPAFCRHNGPPDYHHKHPVTPDPRDPHLY